MLNPLHSTSLFDTNDRCIEVIDVENIIVRPPIDGKLLLTRDIQKPCYRIIGDFLKPVKKYYDINLPNTINIKSNDILNIVLKIPMELGHYHIQELSPDDFNILLESISMRLSFESEEGCFNFPNIPFFGNHPIDLILSSFIFSCGWLTINARFTIKIKPENRVFSKVCKMQYSLCFGNGIPLINTSIRCNPSHRNNLGNTKFQYENTTACLYIKSGNLEN